MLITGVSARGNGIKLMMMRRAQPRNTGRKLHAMYACAVRSEWRPDRETHSSRLASVASSLQTPMPLCRWQRLLLLLLYNA
jgi:hypothetical protein